MAGMCLCRGLVLTCTPGRAAMCVCFADRGQPWYALVVGGWGRTSRKAGVCQGRATHEPTRRSSSRGVLVLRVLCTLRSIRTSCLCVVLARWAVDERGPRAGGQSVEREARSCDLHAVLCLGCFCVSCTFSSHPREPPGLSAARHCRQAASPCFHVFSRSTVSMRVKRLPLSSGCQRGLSCCVRGPGLLLHRTLPVRTRRMSTEPSPGGQGPALLTVVASLAHASGRATLQPAPRPAGWCIGRFIVQSCNLSIDRSLHPFNQPTNQAAAQQPCPKRNIAASMRRHAYAALLSRHASRRSRPAVVAYCGLHRAHHVPELTRHTKKEVAKAVKRKVAGNDSQKPACAKTA